MLEKVNGFRFIGCGGIGGAISTPACRYISFTFGKDKEPPPITLVDGDKYEPKNLERQNCNWEDMDTNKAEVELAKLEDMFPLLDISAFPHYVNSKNVGEVIHDGDVVFLGLDNHKSRSVIAAHCENLDNVILISGGNEMTDGNVQIFVKKNGEKITANLHEYHPEIASPKDKSPDEVGCQVLAESNPQLYFMNLQIATLMLVAFHNLLHHDEEKDTLYGEVYTDISVMKTAPAVRKPRAVAQEG